MDLEMRPSRKAETNVRKLKRAAKDIGYVGIPESFLEEVADKLTEYDVY